MARTKVKAKTKDEETKKNVGIARSLRDSGVVACRLSHS